MAIRITKRENGSLKKSEKFSEIFSNWQGNKEKALFVAPHDDDIVLGGGLSLLKWLENGLPAEAMITTDGSMGYCSADQESTISAIRGQETTESFNLLGVKNVHFLGFPDCNLGNWGGRFKAKDGDPAVFGGHTGLQNAYTKMLREIRPTRVFVPTGNDLHPDHQNVYNEFQISLFHASGDIWPELGKPLETIPTLYEMAIYCDFTGEPDIQIDSDEEEFEKKLKGIEVYRSQKQIKSVIDNTKKSGAVEYLKTVEFNLYLPDNYRSLFK